MRFARAASVMYGGTLPSPCFAKPHFCVQPRKPRQRGSRRAEVLEKNAIFGTFMAVRNIAFFYITLSVFAELAVDAVDFIAWVAFCVPMCREN